MPDEVSTGVHALKDRGRFGSDREALSAQDDSDRFPARRMASQAAEVSRVRGAAHGKPGDGAKGPQMLDRLVRRSILTCTMESCVHTKVLGVCINAARTAPRM